MATTIFKRGMDNLQNGLYGGAAVGILVVYGKNLYDWIVPKIPVSLTTFAGEFSIPIIVIGTFALIGYLLDRY